MALAAETDSEDAIRAEARAWLLRHALDGLPLHDNEEFQRWRRTSERHAQVFKEIEQTWSDAASLQDLRHLVEPDRVRSRLVDSALDSPSPIRPVAAARKSQRLYALAAGVVIAVVVGLGAWNLQRPQVYETRVGEVRDVALPDGSVLTLGGKTQVAVRMAGSSRHAGLRSGEIFLSVHPDKQRPFFVAVGATQIRVVGTQFDVRRGAAQVEIGVLEGTVEVKRAEPALSLFRSGAEPSAAKVLHGGQQLTASSQGELGEPQGTGAVQPGAWRQGRRVYIDAPLREIVADANRYSRQQIELADAALGELKVSVSFRAENQQQMFNGLQLALPLVVERPQPDRVVLRGRVVVE